MRATLSLFLLIGLSASSLLWGHQTSRTNGENSSPVGTTSMALGAQNRMGYGYIGSSEAATDAVMTFSCAGAEISRTVGEICNYTGSITSDAVNTFIQNSAAPAVIEGIRTKIYEEHFLKRYAMQQFPDGGTESETALNGAPPAATAEARLGYPQHCMNWNRTSRQGQARFMRLRRVHNGIPEDAVIEGLPRADKNILNKAKAMDNHWSNANLTKAVVLYDYFKSAKDKACARRSEFASACSDLSKKLNDVTTSYPIFGSDYADDLEDIRANMYRLYGVKAVSRDDNALALKTGKKQYLKDLKRTNSNFWETKAYPNIIDKIEAVIREQSELEAPQNAMVARYATSLREKAQALKQKIYDKDDRQYWTDTCSMNLTELVEKYPNAVRQYMVDASPENRRLGQIALCKQSNFTPLPDKNCQGVSKQSDGSIKINSHTISYPYGSDRRYKITPTGDADAPYEVSMNMRFEINPELYKPAPRSDRQAEIDAKIAAWKDAAQGFYECQYGTRTSFNGRSCPPGGALPPGTPKVRFKFNFVSPGKANSDTTTIKLHKCFNADAPTAQESTCRGVQRFNQTRFDDDASKKCVKGVILNLWYQPDIVAMRTRLTADQRARLCIHNATSVNPTLPPADIMSDSEIKRLGRLRFNNLSGSAINVEELLNTQNGNTVLTNSERDRRSAATRLSSTSYSIPETTVAPASTNSYYLDLDTPMSPSLYVATGDLYARVICLPDPTGSDFNSNAKTACKQVFGGPDMSNRENAGNYTLNQPNGTVYHEVGHIFGLDDEYLDPTYPYTPQGEHDSVMNSSNDNDRLHDRHLQQLLSPLSCPAAQ